MDKSGFIQTVLWKEKLVKKPTVLFLVILCAVCCVGCGVQKQFPEYYGLDTMKGLEVYLWQDADGEYMCGVLSGTNRNKTFEEINSLIHNGATVEQMKVILSSYNIDKDEIQIIPINISETYFEILTSDFESAKKVFWDD